ncbi:MAG: tRNA uracil 4-sulfurtransferase ThiI [Lentisphaeria bacterium]
MCRYGEIALKGRNRSQFERRLLLDLKRHLADVKSVEAGRERGRIVLWPQAHEKFTPAEIEQLRKRLPMVFGLASASPALKVNPEVNAIEEIVMRHFPQIYRGFADARPEGTEIRYAMRARRNNPDFPKTSRELEIHFADKLLSQYPGLKIDLMNPELQISVEVRRNAAFIFFEQIAGPGGLPRGSAGRMLALLSGGIDSPVASYESMRRGGLLDFVTFHSAPYTPPATVRKTTDLGRRLHEFQHTGKLFAVNLLEAQKQIRDNCREKFRTLLYRRLMMRISREIAAGTHAQALITGENLGQVASQTLENLNIIDEAARMLILRPLITLDKQDIVQTARRIGTFNISSEEAPDSCTVFAPKRPATKARLEAVRQEEEKLEIQALIEQSRHATTVIDLESGAERKFQT